MSQVTGSALDSYTGSGSLAEAAGGNDTLDKEAFLTLLITQFQYQDPLNPMEDKEFIAQLAQFSSLEQSMAMNEKMEEMTASINHQTSISITNYIGKEVSARGYGISKEGSATSLIQYAGNEPMESCVVNILDANRNIVTSVDLGAKAAGIHDFTWDGMYSNGSEAPDGVYEVNFVGKNAEGNSVYVDTSVSGRVTGTSLYNGQYFLRMSDGRSVQLTEVYEVVEAAPVVEGKIISGTSDDDYIEGTTADDIINAGAGDDIIVYDAKDENVDAGSGFDFLIADGEIESNAKNYEAIIRGTDASSITSLDQLKADGLTFFEGKVDVSNQTWLENWEDKGDGQWVHKEKLMTIEFLDGNTISTSAGSEVGSGTATTSSASQTAVNPVASIPVSSSSSANPVAPISSQSYNSSGSFTNDLANGINNAVNNTSNALSENIQSNVQRMMSNLTN